MSDKFLNKKAFSLVEAMIILVLISVAIMALMPLLNPRKSTVPKWGPIRDANKNVVGTFYGLKSLERVGLGDVDPYDINNPNKNAKLALNTLMLRGASDLSSVVWGNNYIGANYSDLTPMDESIQIGMNTCNEGGNANSGKIIIRSNTVAAGGNLLNCTGQNPDLINIGNKIIGKNNTTFALGTTDISMQPDADLRSNAKIYISNDTAGTSDEFLFRYPNNNLAMSFSNNTLTISPQMTVNGDFYLSGYDLTSNVNSNSNIQCDRNASGECIHYAPYANYKHKLDKTGQGATFGGWGRNWGTRMSDIRLKNILTSYTKGIKEINKVDTYLYTFKADKAKQIRAGILAQKIKGIFDEALHKDASGYYSYDRNPILYALTNSAKEINDKQENLSKTQKNTNNEADRLIRMYK